MFKDKDDFIAAYKTAFVEESGNAFEDSDMERRYYILVNMIRERLSQDWLKSRERFRENGHKQVFYFSMEFLMGKLLVDYLLGLGLYDTVAEGLAELGLDLQELAAYESDAGLGNGGLGRLAACFLDSMAYLGIPGNGNGIRYRYGFFKQKIIDGFQAEMPDNWLINGYPWEIRKPEKSVIVRYKGTVKEKWVDGHLTVVHEGYEPVRAVPYDVPVIGFGGKTINNLRLWSAEPVNEVFDLSSFNRGELSLAIRSRSEVEAISYILYPEDSSPAGRELRLKQEYFFVAAGIQNIVSTFIKRGGDLAHFSRKIAIHINDTHPALAIPELMRVLMDENGVPWNRAWETTVQTMSYTNHTIPAGAGKMGRSLFRPPAAADLPNRAGNRPPLPGGTGHPRRRWGERYRDPAPRFRLDGEPRRYRQPFRQWRRQTAHRDLKNTVLKDFYRIFPDRFSNKTNGVSHRRFLLKANPKLSALIGRTIGEGWLYRPQDLIKLKDRAGDAIFLTELAAVKYENKCRLARHIFERTGTTVDPNSIFDVHIKRIHAYKRQLLNVLKIMALYDAVKENPDALARPLTFLFAGKAASGYHYAKTIIKLINTVAEQINGDAAIDGRLKVVFLEDFNVSASEIICPATDISEQISTASKEASGTGNMKFMFNGAVTLGTMDGANVEIHDIVGPENMFAFGLSAQEVLHLYRHGGYCSWDLYHSDPLLRTIVDHLIDGSLPGDRSQFCAVYDDLLRDNDPFFTLKDFHSYLDAWKRAAAAYEDREKWQRISLYNIAAAGYFSSDRTIKEYADEIWHTPYTNNGTPER